MDDREQLYTLLAQKDWETIGKIIYKNKKAKTQDPFLAQVTTFFEAEFFPSQNLCRLLSAQSSLSSLT